MAKPPIDGLTAQIATQSWLAEWRRAWVRLHPTKECPVLAWEAYSSAEQGLMIRAVKAAIAAASPENVASVIARRGD
uniref:hypothetical protein n=1 Tax=Methylobacterium sp. B34 TaxID=95563 RepID=UPI00034DFB54|nr:hypothetical protein [Methylobacterium sp. B34]